MRYHVVTTMNAEGWRQTGRRMAESFLARWPAECGELAVYAEGFDPDIDGVTVRSLPGWLWEFRERHRSSSRRNGKPGQVYDYRYDAVKFSHKVAALTHFGVGLDGGVMIWLDADIFTHAPVTADWLRKLFPEPAYLAWLDRARNHPECGFLMFRAGHPKHREFMRKFRDLYQSDDVFRLPEWHDSFVLQHLVRISVVDGLIPPPASLSGRGASYSHPAANGPLSACIDHLKGPRKGIGRTPKNERFIRDGNAYWS